MEKLSIVNVALSGVKGLNIAHFITINIFSIFPWIDLYTCTCTKSSD